MSKLKLYFPEYFEFGYVVHKPFCTKKNKDKNIDDVLLSFEKLIDRYDLCDHLNELLEIAGIVSCQWNRVEYLRDLKSPHFKRMHNDATALSKVLKKMITEYDNENDGFLFSKVEFRGGSISDQTILRVLLGSIDYSEVLSELEWIKQMNIENSEILEKYSFPNLFIKPTLLPFYNFLITDTKFKSESINETYRFIYEFCEVVGVEWKGITYQKPEDYFKIAFSRI